MKRNIDNYLTDWKLQNKHKVLILRGARQVGKTYSVRQLGKTFPGFIEINFELDQDVKFFFQQSLNPEILVEKLSAYYSTEIIAGETLLFFDEIQECEEALKSLRFFYEKMPELHVIAAGSLLEFAISEIASFAVGRITNLFMKPLTFNEFLSAINEKALINITEKADFDKPIDLPFFNRLSDIYKTYCLIGGLPEVVQTYIDTRNLIQCQKVLSDLIISFKDDFAKYKKRSPIDCLNETFNSIVFQTGSKFVFSNVNSHSSHKLLIQSLEMLVMAGLAYKIHHTSASGLPLGSQVNLKKFKVILFDVGIHQQIAGVDIPSFLTATNYNVMNKGNTAELFAGLELLGNDKPFQINNLYYWHRESKSSNAEIDYIIQKGNTIIPIEVKAGTKGQMQSMHLFLQEKKLDYGIRFSLENFSVYNNIKTIPIFAINNIFEKASF
jgi:predicted AAA+ superfamily ATPase